MSVANKLIRRILADFEPYSTARDEYSSVAGVFLDANENSFGSTIKNGLNRYPDPQQYVLKREIGMLKNIEPQRIFIGNGSDEAIDLLFRAFCEPGRDKVIVMPPTYGMYEVCAQLNNIKVIEVPLLPDFEVDLQKVLQSIADDVKLIFICSPNNPTGNVFAEEDITAILGAFDGLVVIDEAYIDFAKRSGWLHKLKRYENLVVIQTFSKAWGMANIRLGMAFADKDIISVLSSIKYPYNVNGITQKMALYALKNVGKKEKMVKGIIKQRLFLQNELSRLHIATKVFVSEANFILVKFKEARKVYKTLVARSIIVRDRSDLIHCKGCLRITVGKKAENKLLISVLKELDS